MKNDNKALVKLIMIYDIINSSNPKTTIDTFSIIKVPFIFFNL